MLVTGGFLVNFKNPTRQKVKRLPSDIGVSVFEIRKFKSTEIWSFEPHESNNYFGAEEAR